MTTKHRRTLLIAVLIGIVAVSLTIYGIASHSEPGLLTACAVESPRDGATLYDYEAEEPCFDVRLEGSAPFIIALPWAFDVGGRLEKSKDYRQILETVVSQTNARVRFELLRIGDPQRAERATILYFPEESPQDGLRDANGVAQHIVGGRGELHCFVHTYNTPTDELEEDVLMHEIGHCLGLAHDDHESSIMRRRMSPTPMGQFPPWFSDHDVELLQELYRNE